ncbi:hypothetical protein [Profundibacter sp.]
MTDPVPMTEAEMITLAANGVGKVDYHGKRGITLVTMAEIEAMAALLVCMGLSPTEPPVSAANQPNKGD